MVLDTLKEWWDEPWGDEEEAKPAPMVASSDPLTGQPVMVEEGQEMQPYRDEMINVRQQELQRLMGRIPSSDELIEMERANIAGELSGAHQNLVSNAAARGLTHSGILRAQQQKLTAGGFGQMQAARARAENFPESARAQLLTAMATGKPLPEIMYETQPSGAVPFALGLLGAGIGAGVGGGPAGAGIGMGIGQATGQMVEGGPTYHKAGRSYYT